MRASVRPPPWHTLDAREVLSRMDASEEGLSTAEARRRLEAYGPNRLHEAEPVSAWHVLLDQGRSVLVVVLVLAALLALLVGDVLEASALGAVLVINTAIGFVAELRARRAMHALIRFDVPHARVRREGTLVTVSADELVPGDVIALEGGDRVPADARLLSATALRVDEALLTGESVPVDKDVAPLVAADTVLAERAPLVHAGTSVTGGRASAVVFATGPTTEVGRVGMLVSGIESGRTPLERRLDTLGHRMVWLTGAVAAVVIGLGLLRGAPIRLVIETGVALGIAAMPEGLPAVATIALAVGLRRMARRHALVRRLSSVEALGATTVVCTDKTGTLTAGEMTVTRIVTTRRDVAVTGRGYAAVGGFEERGGPLPEIDEDLAELLRACALTSRAEVDPDGGNAVGDPTDLALLVVSRKGHVERQRLRAALPEVEEIPFTIARRMSATIHEGPGGRRIVYAKGAPEAVLSGSTLVQEGGAVHPMTTERRARLEAHNEALSADGLRVIALARAMDDTLQQMTHLGLVGIVDPPADGVPETIGTLQGAGIRAIMITGDQRATATAIARSLGIPADRTDLTGRDLNGLDDEALTGRVADVGVYSRVTPEQKLRVVEALQRSGEIVAMIGDGINDAAALKRADVGVAMGLRGTDAAKETASIVLGDDRFPTIAVAVEEGRVIYENIRKFVFYLFSCNLAEVLVILLASLSGAPTPLLPLQLLWLNLVTDTLPALALAMEPSEPGIMARPPRAPDEAILSRRFVGALSGHALVITVVTLAAYAWGLTGAPRPGRAETLAFATLGLAQLLHLGNARSHGPVVARARIVANPWALASLPVVAGLQLVAVEWQPLSAVLGTTPLGPVEWSVVIALASVPAVVGQGVELLQQRHRSLTSGAIAHRPATKDRRP